MDYISPTDLYQIKLSTLISNVDKDVLIELYQPIVGSLATIFFLNLFRQKRSEEEKTFYTFESLLLNMHVSAADLLTARRSLEGVGLLKTYLKDSDGTRTFLFELYAPKAPKDFFDDVLFRGLLVQSLGKKAVNKLAKIYVDDSDDIKDFKDISASFNQVFTPDLNDLESFDENVIDKKVITRNVGKVSNKTFDFKIFEESLKKYLLNINNISDKCLVQIERLSNLFGIKEDDIAEIVSSIYRRDNIPHIVYEDLFDALKNSINFEGITKVRKTVSTIRGNTNIEKKIKLMEEKEPIKFLALLQNNITPASSDIYLVDFISKKYSFSNGVINALIDYCLEQNNNILTKNYIDKIASSLAREGIETTIDAMNFLKKTILEKNKVVKNAQTDKTIKTDKKSVLIEEISEEEMIQIRTKLEELKGGKING